MLQPCLQDIIREISLVASAFDRDYHYEDADILDAAVVRVAQLAQPPGEPAPQSLGQQVALLQQALTQLSQQTAAQIQQINRTLQQMQQNQSHSTSSSNPDYYDPMQQNVTIPAGGNVSVDAGNAASVGVNI